MYGFMGTMQHLKKEVITMKKTLIFTFLMSMLVFNTVFAADWSDYESGRNNIRLDGYDGQPGYIKFTDGNGTVRGYLWMSADNTLVYCSRMAINQKTTKLSDTTHGLPISILFSGSDQQFYNPSVE